MRRERRWSGFSGSRQKTQDDVQAIQKQTTAVAFPSLATTSLSRWLRGELPARRFSLL